MKRLLLSSSGFFALGQWLLAILLALFAWINRCLPRGVPMGANASVEGLRLFGNGAGALKLPASIWRSVVFVALVVGMMAMGRNAWTTEINVPANQSTIQAGIDAAIDGDIVLVQPGTYVENINFYGKNITVKSTDGAENTVIDGNKQGSVVTLSSDSATLSGFTITNGSAQYGGGIVMSGINNSILKNLIITSNSSHAGGGISCHGSSPTIENITISGNSSEYAGGGIYCHSGNPILSNVVISDNQSNLLSGGVYFIGGNPTLSHVTIVNNTISSKTGGVGIWLNGANLILKNSIVWGNSANGIYAVLSATSTVTYSDIQGGWEGEGNIDIDPLFVDAENGDYHLSANTPTFDTNTLQYMGAYKPEFILSITKIGTGEVKSNDNLINCGSTCQGSYNLNDKVTLVASASTGSTFTGWTGACNGTNATTTVTMDTVKACTANFAATTYTLDVAKNGEGTITSNPTGINCGRDCNENYAFGTEVTLTATPSLAFGFGFKEWSGDCSGSDATITVAISDAKNCMANFVLSSIKVGEFEETEKQIEYSVESGWTQNIHYPNAAYIKVHFLELNVANGDYITVSNPEKTQVHTYPGSGFTLDKDQQGFWALSIVGDTAIVTLNSSHAGEMLSDEEYGITIDKYARGYPTNEILELIQSTQGREESTCGTNQRTDVACYQSSHPTEYNSSKAVARMLKSGMYLCTAWRVGPQNYMFSNEHCITDQSELSSSEFWFNYQRPVCKNGNPAIPTIVTGNNLLAVDYTLDFALFTINNINSIQQFGYLDLDVRPPMLNEEMYIPQHGAGNPKEFGIESDLNYGNCRIDNAIADGRGTNTDTGYFCDTTGGSSGSPVLASSSHKVIAIHHWGGCENQGVRIDKIWPLVEPFFKLVSLTVIKTGNGIGTVTSTPTGIDCGNDCKEDYTLNTDVTLTATPNSNSVFTGWTGACTGTSPTVNVTMNVAKSCTATFFSSEVTLDVLRTGNGIGTVTSTPAGIDCGNDCKEDYTLNTDVTLTATPNSNSVFTGWTGACTGTSPTVNVTMNVAKSCTATFVPSPQEYVGVISNSSCPTSTVKIYMDDEDRRNANNHVGWIGTTSQGRNTTFRFCRVNGSNFKRAKNGNYAVLKLGNSCPPSSIDFSRYFDNEDNRNANWYTGNISPNVSNRNTTLKFCFFPSDSSGGFDNPFANLGFDYGVIASQNSLPNAVEYGRVHTDDEDRRNANKFSFSTPSYKSRISQFIYGGRNTDIHMARVKSPAANYPVQGDVGVIPSSNCPTGYETVRIHMDDEDRRNANHHTGWIGATSQGRNTTFTFCRVNGGNFKRAKNGDYAVLKLSNSSCPTGSFEFSRYFDNEDNRNANWYTGNISPNVSNRNTTLRFCFFPSDSTGGFSNPFANLGFNYGVLANRSSLSNAVEYGRLHTDDEDKRNRNRFDFSAQANQYRSRIYQLIHGGRNTDFHFARVKGPITKRGTRDSNLELVGTLKSSSGTIQPTQTIRETVMLDSVINSLVTFRVKWPGSNLDLVITSPSGQLIDSSSDIVKDYYAGDTQEYFTIEVNETGVWNVDVVAIDVTSQGEFYELDIVTNEKADLSGEEVDVKDTTGPAIDDEKSDEYTEPFSGTIQATQTIRKAITLESIVNRLVTFKVKHSNGNLDLVITTPNGQRIDSSNSIVKDYYDGETQEYYTVETDEAGTWNIDIVAVDVAPQGEFYEFEVLTNEKADLSGEELDIKDTTDPDDDEKGEELLVKGNVLDKLDNPLANVTIQIGDKTTLSDATGCWELSGLADGQYTVIASKEGFEFESQNFTVDGEDVTLNLEVKDNVVSTDDYSTSGIIRDKIGNPLAGVTIQIGEKTTVTDAAGNWQIHGLPEGEYTVIASKDGYRFDTTPCVVSNNVETCQPKIKAEPLLDVKVVPKPRVAKQGENVTYRITVTNQGEGIATNVTLVDTLPENVELVRLAALDGGDCDAGTLTCNLPDLTPGATANLELVISNRLAETLVNTVTVTTKEYPTEVKKTRTSVKPYLSVTMIDQPDPVAMLNVLHYSLVVELSHYAPSEATGVTLVSQLPQGVELKSIHSDYGVCDTIVIFLYFHTIESIYILKNKIYCFNK